METLAYTAFVLDTQTRLIQLWCPPGRTRQWVTPYLAMPEPATPDTDAEIFIDIAQTMFAFEADEFVRVGNTCIFFVDCENDIGPNQEFVQSHGGPSCIWNAPWDMDELLRIDLHPAAREAIVKNLDLFEHVCNMNNDLYSPLTLVPYAAP